MTRRSPAIYPADPRTPRPAPSSLSRARRRRGFTIIELLMVVLVIGILVALLFPAIQNAIAATRETQVVTEMSSIDKAIVDFKARYGIEPPSFMVLYEEGDDWDPSNPAAQVSDAQHRASRAIIRQLWPDFDFLYGGSSGSGGNIDLNGNGADDDVLILNGTECLVFFLGGVFQRGSTDGEFADDAIVGFSANPLYPFDSTSSNNRIGPFFTFDLNRLTDIDDDDMPEYMDPLPSQSAPYVYVSSYEGRGYRPYGMDFVPPSTNPSTDDDELFGLSFMYYQDNDDGDSTVFGPALNPQTYQLISPGEDGNYGTGGEYDGERVSADRPDERDNITNFKGGRLN